MAKRSGNKIVGSKAEVFHGTATHTPGGVTRTGLKQKEDGRIVFRSKSEAAKNGPGFKKLKDMGRVVPKGVNPFK